VAATVVANFAGGSLASGSFAVVSFVVVSFAVGNFVVGFAGENFTAGPLASHYSHLATAVVNSAVEAVVLQRSSRSRMRYLSNPIHQRIS
jgi:hypothetical protein